MMTPFFILLVMMIFGGLFWGWTGATLAFALFFACLFAEYDDGWRGR
jgi:hypothetical protein